MTAPQQLMRSQEEIVAKINSEDSFFGFGKQVYVSVLDFEHAKQYLKDGVTEEEWAEAQVTDVRREFETYLDFAIGKALDHRGLSAHRSVEKLNAWSWLMGHDEPIEEPYPTYGVPILKALAERHDVPWPQGNEDLDRMARGEPCRENCNEGCLA